MLQFTVIRVAYGPASRMEIITEMVFGWIITAISKCRVPLSTHAVNSDPIRLAP